MLMCSVCRKQQEDEPERDETRDNVDETMQSNDEQIEWNQDELNLDEEERRRLETIIRFVIRLLAFS